MPTNCEMTIYNRYTEPFTNNIKYKKHLIKEAFWDDSTGISLKTGFENNDKVNIYIPFDKNEEDLKEYKEPKKYNGNGWTIQSGDYVIKNNVPIEEIEKIKELSEYEVFEITEVDKKDFGSYNMQHFEIKGH